MTRVLVVDDEEPLRRALAANLVARGYGAEIAADAGDALGRITAAVPDAVILDLGLPDLDGLDVIRRVRSWSSVPIIVLSARRDEADKVAALDAGADDYVTKPFGVDELFARLRAALRRHVPGDETAVVSTAHFVLDLADRSATRTDGAPCRLTPIEWRIVEHLVRRPGALVTQRELFDVLGVPAADRASSLVRVHFVHIRRKLEPNPVRPRYFVTEPRLGYRFLPDT